MRAICLLYGEGLSEEAQSLVRVLFELQVSFATFVKMLGADMTDACRRLFDSVILAKVKQQRACDFQGLELVPGGPSRQDLEEDEREIASRYSPPEYKAMRKKGFSGQSVEARCKALDKRMGGSGYTDIYNIIYRNFSRNVHSTDITETLLHVDPGSRNARARDLVESRDGVACDLVLTVVLDMVGVLNREFKLGLEKRITKLRDLRDSSGSD